MMNRTAFAALAALTFVASSLDAQAGPPVRVLGPAAATSSEPLGPTLQVRPLPGGRLLLNDAAGRKVLMLDSNLKVIRVVADTASGSETAYGPRPARLLAYRGDSSLLIDAGSLSMLVLDGQGNIVKVRAIPRTEHATYIGSTSLTYGNPGFDADGRLIYRANDPVMVIRTDAAGGVLVPEQPDSGALLRMDLATRKLDTAGKYKIQKRITEAYRMASGGISQRTLTNPMPVVDDWAVMADGSIALVRHRDYHVDWVNPDGTLTSSPPMPFDWQRLTDDHKKAFIDSLRYSIEARNHTMMASYDSMNLACFRITLPERAPLRAAPYSTANTPAGRGAGPGGEPLVLGAGGVRSVGAAGGGAAAAGGSGAARAAATPPPTPIPGAASADLLGLARGPGGAPACPSTPIPVNEMFGPVNTVQAHHLPDYKPPFSANAARADADNNLWIRVNQMKPVAGTYLYDIVNRQGEIIDRIQMPMARTLVGFGSGNVVYVLTRDAAGTRLERVRWK